MPTNNSEEIRLKGINASPGICIGKAYLVGSQGVDVVETYYIGDKELQKEIKRFKSAVKGAQDELRTISENVPEDLRKHSDILETHVILLKDKMLYDKIIETIKSERVNAEWALRKVATDVQAMFQSISNEYLKERAYDIEQVAERIMSNLIGSTRTNIKEISKRVILVAHDISPADTSQIATDRIMGFVTDRGGRTSHTSIIARALEIPAVLGLETATQMIKNDDLLIIDGTTGVVIINPDDRTLVEFEERIIRYEEYKSAIVKNSHLQAKTKDGLHVLVMGNIEMPEEVSAVIDFGGDGIGLYRTEFQYLNQPSFPSEDQLFVKYKEVVEVITPKPVTIRTLDINGDKAIANSYSEEENPALGLRAIRYCLKKPEVFKPQLRAILRASAFGNVRILFPLISTYHEIIEARKMLKAAADSLEKDGLAFNKNIEVGIMIEVPSAVTIADILANEADFFSIGTNDLIQYSFAVDRGNKQVAYLYRALDPAIIRMIKHVTDVGKQKKIKVFMCGEMAGDPINTPILLGLGVDELSMSPQSMPAVKSMIRSLEVKDVNNFIKEVMEKMTASEILELLKNRYGDILPEQANAWQ
ncbi:MAG: phosphoenolpyruvate--protein phosphotransferase [Desulfobacterales bacterium]|nr:phosphoenolpyruvate--protein phosphotransferase [Desulfobacterales bacterium]